MERPPLELGDLVKHWTLVGAEGDLAAAKHSDTQLGFALLLKFYGRFGRFPRGRSELHDDAVAFVAGQLGVSAGSLGFYEWSGRTVKRHRAEIRAHFGFRECTVADAEELAGWLAGGCAQEERRYELVRNELLAECRSWSIEPPTPDRVERIVRSGLHQAEKILTARIAGRLPAEVWARLLTLASADAGEDDSEADPVGLDYWIGPGQACGLGSSLSDLLESLPARAQSARLPDGAGPA